MERNPYTAPGTRVVDAEEPARERPLAVKRAIVLMCIDLLISLVVVVADWGPATAKLSPVFLASYEFVAIAVMIWLIVKIAAGRNWARITLLVLEIVTLPPGAYGLPEIAARAPVIAGLNLIVIGLDLAILFLLFFPGRAYFAKPKS